MRQCRICKIKKKNSEFYKNPKDKSGYYSECKICLNKRTAETKLISKYNLTTEQRDAMILKQNNRCVICNDLFSDSKRTHVDHCHNTNKVRAILCHLCNTALGGFKDDLKILQNAIDYLEYHVKQNLPTPVSDEDNWEGELHPQHRAISTAGTGEDSYDLDHYQRTVQGEDADYRTQTRGGDGMGYGSEEVGPPKTPQSEQDNGVAYGKIVSYEELCRHIFDKP
jgi:hypothetical protein